MDCLPDAEVTRLRYGTGAVSKLNRHGFAQVHGGSEAADRGHPECPGPFGCKPPLPGYRVNDVKERGFFWGFCDPEEA